MIPISTNKIGAKNSDSRTVRHLRLSSLALLKHIAFKLTQKFHDCLYSATEYSYISWSRPSSCSTFNISSFL